MTFSKQKSGAAEEETEEPDVCLNVLCMLEISIVNSVDLLSAHFVFLCRPPLWSLLDHHL